ncbi:MAG TPA: DUF1538 domain-containing protein [Rhodospirillales bacterium]|nr:DUF1538 domain-containing protein [Rhodospirillales bacterium]
MEMLTNLFQTAIATFVDVLPIAAVLLGFQIFVLRQKPRHLSRILIGLVYVLLGLTFFLVGLEKALFPIGKAMAEQLTDPLFTGQLPDAAGIDWTKYMWVYAFAWMIGFATTIAEPSLIAVSLKAEEVAGGSLSALGLRLAVAFGVAFGVTIGVYRIVVGDSLGMYIMTGYVIVIIQTFFSSKTIIPLAYDSGGVTTSTVTVPVLAALGLGLAIAVPGRSPLLDGFGLIAFASVFPIITVLGYDIVTSWLLRQKKNSHQAEVED